MVFIQKCLEKHVILSPSLGITNRNFVGIKVKQESAINYIHAFYTMVTNNNLFNVSNVMYSTTKKFYKKKLFENYFSLMTIVFQIFLFVSLLPSLIIFHDMAEF